LLYNMLALVNYITNYGIAQGFTQQYLNLVFNLMTKVKEPRSRAQWLTIVGNVSKDEKMISHIVQPNDGCVLKIVIESILDTNFEVKSASVKAAASFLLSTNAQLMANIINIGYLENITILVFSSNDEELLKTALWGLSNFVTTDASVSKLI
jgi:hypothetical protein